MRAFIGHKVKLIVEGIGSVEGIVVSEDKQLIFVRGGDERITRIVKTKICGFSPVDFEPFDYVPFIVLFCENKALKCPGVIFCIEGDRFNRNDIETFMAPCPKRCDSCKYGSRGELRTVDGDTLRRMLGDAMFGDYPEEKESGHNTASRRTESGKGRGAKAGRGKKSAGGGTDKRQEASDDAGEEVQG